MIESGVQCFFPTTILGAGTLLLDDSGGNANGVWDAGEAVAIEPAWANTGVADATGVTGAVSSTDLITITDGAATAGICRHVHYIAAQGVASGCTATEFCPTSGTTRGQMASFLVNASALALYGP